MIIYNVTVKIQSEVHQEWLKWMKEVHIPDVMKTGKFVEHKFCKVLFVDQDEGQTYSIQYFCKDMATLESYIDNESKPLQKEHTEKYKDKFVAFRTLLEIQD